MAVIKNMMVRAGADFSAFTTQAKKATKSMRGMQSSISRSCAGVKASVGGMKKVLSGLGVAVSVAAVISAGKRAAEAYDQQAEAEMKLAAVMRNTMSARNKEIQSVLDLCSAQQRLGVIGDEVQLAGAQELATYLTQSRTLRKLIPVMNDMVAQQYGFSASAENATNIATMLGKVMNGQVGALSRLGYSFTEAQEKILKYGNEAERAATLADVINQSVGGMNRALANTPTGRMKQLSNTLGDIKEKFGECIRLIGVLLLPLLWRVADVLERIADFANRAAVSLNRVFGSTANLTGWQRVSTGVGEVTEELGDAVTEAKELKRTVAGFDTLNILGGKDKDTDQSSAQAEGSGIDSTGSGAGRLVTGLGDEIGEATEGLGWFEKLLTKVRDNLQLVKDKALAVGAGLAAWKIARNLGAGLKQTLGLVGAVEGAVHLGLNAFRAWNNGVDMSNLQGMLSGTISLASGLGVAFGNVGAAIGLCIGGGTQLVVGMREWISTGQLTHENSLAIASGLGEIGAAIFLLTGQWLPALIVGLAGVGVAIYGCWDEITAWLGSVNAWLGEWWAGTIEPGIAAAIQWIVQGFTDLGTELGILWHGTLVLGTSIGTAIQTVWTACINVIKTTAQVAATLIKQWWDNLKATTQAVFTAIQTFITTTLQVVKSVITTNVTAAVTAAKAQWQALLTACQSIFTGIHAHITSIIQQCTAYIAGTSWYGLGVNLMQGFLNGLRSLMSTIWNEVVAFVQRCVDAVRNALGVHSPSKVFEEIGVMVDEGALKGLRSGIPEILAEGEGMAEGLVKAVTPAALDVSGSYEGAGARFQSTEEEEAPTGGGEGVTALLPLLEAIYDAILEGKEINIDGEAVFNTVVRQNNRAINRTGMSPLRA